MSGAFGLSVVGNCQVRSRSASVREEGNPGEDSNLVRPLLRILHYIRTQTPLSYKQNKFNLTREQSEGWSKFTTELTGSLGPSHSTSSGLSTEDSEALSQRARGVWDRLVSLIGAFDLDPNRALDVILDVLSVHLAAHHTFLLALLSFSPWSGSYRLSGGDMQEELTPHSYNGKTLDEILTLAAGDSPTLLSNKSRVMAQVLGFKFAHYLVCYLVLLE